MRRIALFTLLTAALAGCDDDDPTGAAISADYTLVSAAPSFDLRQDSTADLGVRAVRDDTVNLTSVRLVFTSDDVSIARVSAAGIVTALDEGQTTIRVQGQTSSLAIPVTVRPYTADNIELSVLSGPAGANPIGTRLATNEDTGTFYALPANAASSRLKAVVRVGTDTVYCNYCPPRTPPRLFRAVVFRSLDESKATVSNASDPTVQGTGTADAGVDLAGWVTAQDTASEVKIVLEVPADNLADTVTLKLALRPINKLRIRPDSTFVPTANGTGLAKTIWPNHTVNDTLQGNAQRADVTNFSVGITFLALVQNLPRANSATSPTATSLNLWIPITPFGNVTARRTNLPAITWESANNPFLTINAAGVIVAPCAFIGGACNTSSQTIRNGMVLNCTDTTGQIPETLFGGEGTYLIPSCGTPAIPMPGAFCSSATDTLDSTCSIWIRASTTDPATLTPLSRLYRINVRR